MTQLIYKICPQDLWQEAISNGVFNGAPIDLADGFIHFSTRAQVMETAAKHFTGQTNLLLIAIDKDIFGDALKYETSRNDDLFPHLYGTFSPEHAFWVRDFKLDDDGKHIFPED